MTFPRFGLALALALASIPVTSALLAGTARADDPEPEVSSDPAEEAAATPPDLWSRFLAVEVIGGIDTPYGLVGGAVVVTPWRHLALDLGGGVSRDGGRVAGGARIVLPHANGALGFRVGFAGGPLTWDTRVPGQPGAIDPDHIPTLNQHRSWDFAGFLDLSLSLEVRFDAGVYLRFLFGVEHALGSADRCVETGEGSTGMCATGGVQPARTYVGLALGYAFDL